MLVLAVLVILATPPPPRLWSAYVDVDVKFDKGAVAVLKVRPGKFVKPTAIPRFRGRFTAIVAKGKENLAEVEFDFPGLHQSETDDMTEEARKLAEKLRLGVTSTTTVRVPLPEGADTVAIYDALGRKTVKAPLAGTAGAPPAR